MIKKLYLLCMVGEEQDREECKDLLGCNQTWRSIEAENMDEAFEKAVEMIDQIDLLNGEMIMNASLNEISRTKILMDVPGLRKNRIEGKFRKPVILTQE